VKEQDFKNLIKSVRQAGRIRRGQMKASRVYSFRPADIKSIRSKLGKSQSEFALMIGVSTATLQNWEQGRRVPDGPARALLKVAAERPEVVAEALSAYRG
jgi:putative transcriptional regulator